VTALDPYDLVGGELADLVPEIHAHLEEGLQAVLCIQNYILNAPDPASHTVSFCAILDQGIMIQIGSAAETSKL
jgi:hypothetical protein